jgi:hypothetical protein
MNSLSNVSRRLMVVAAMLFTCPAWAATAVDASHNCGAGSMDDWIALFFALLAGLLCVQQRQN